MHGAKDKEYPLVRRTTDFAIHVVLFCRLLPYAVSTKIVIHQLLRSATSIGANYREANGAVSRNDFKHKISICKKECQETEYWFEIVKSTTTLQERETKELMRLQDESHQLTLIFQKIISTIKESE